MINFFRKVRKKLADDNKPLKYMRYAIGEIVLVVVGILIALSINNWNEDRKDRVRENEILHDIITNLETNIVSLEKTKEEYAIRANSSKILINVLENKLALHDSLSFHFHKGTLGNVGMNNVSRVGYDILKNEGLSILKNKNALDEILSLFEVSYPDLISTNESLSINNSYHQQIFDKYIIALGGPNKKVKNPVSLFEDDRVLTIITRLYYTMGWLVTKIDNCLSQTKRVKQLLELEVTSRFTIS